MEKSQLLWLVPIVGIDGLDTVVLLDLVTKLVAIISLTLPVSQHEFQLISSALGGWCSGPEPVILDWYSHCVRLSMNKLVGLGACCPRKVFKIRTSKIASEAMFGPKMLLESPHLYFLLLEKRPNQLPEMNATVRACLTIKCTIAIEIEKPQFSCCYFECLKT